MVQRGLADGHAGARLDQAVAQVRVLQAPAGEGLVEEADFDDLLAQGGHVAGGADHPRQREVGWVGEGLQDGHDVLFPPRFGDAVGGQDVVRVCFDGTGGDQRELLVEVVLGQVREERRQALVGAEGGVPPGQDAALPQAAAYR